MKDDIATACRILATLLEQGDRCSVAVVQEARAFVDRHASHVAVAVERDAAGRVVPVVVSADVPEDRAERCDGRTLFTCRTCGATCNGWTDGTMSEPGWHDIAHIDGPNAICPACVAAGAVVTLRDEHPQARVDRARRWVSRAPKRCDVPGERRNCWSCTWARHAATECHSPDYHRAEINDWADRTHPPGHCVQCPPDADGCPGWEARP